MRTHIFVLLLTIFPILFFSQHKAEESNKKVKEKKHPKIFIDSTQSIIYDFNTGKYLKDIHRIKVHTPVIFKVKNINPFVYKTTVTPKDSVVGESSFDKEFISALTQKELQNVESKIYESKNLVGNQVQNIDKNDFKGNDNIKNKNKIEINTIDENLRLNIENQKLKIEIEEGLKKVNILNTQIMDGVEKAAGSVPLLQYQKSNLENEILKYNNKISVNQEIIKNNNDKIEKQLKDYQLLLDDFNIKYFHFNKDARDVFSLLRISKKIDVISGIPDLDSLKFSTYSNEVSGYSLELLKGMGEIDDYKKSFSELEIAYYKLLSAHHLDEIMEESGVEKLLSYPKYIKEKASVLNEWFIKYNIDKVISQAFWVTTQLKNNENFVVKSDPIQPENDMIQFHIKIEARDKTRPETNHKVREFNYKQALYGGTRVDFSLGLAAAHYWDAPIYELNYENKITSSSKNIFSPSLIGMITMSWRKTGYLAYGGSFGMGLDVTDGKIQFSNFFIGPTILIGKKQRVFISAGPSVKNVGRIKAGFEGTVVNGTNDLSSYINNYYKIGIFTSITYSLTKDARALIKNLR